MKKRLYLIILFILVMSSITMCGKKEVIVANVAGEKITLADFNTRFEYYLQAKYAQQPQMIPQARNSLEERKAVLRDMINEKLILKEAKKMKIDKQEDVKNMIKLSTQQIILKSYIDKFLAKDINVNDADIDAFYDKNKKYFKNADPEMARKQIKYQLTLKAYDKKIAELIDKLKNKYTIQENDDAIRPILQGVSPQTGTDGKTLNNNTSPQIKLNNKPSAKPEAK